jgi:uncharacterized membrane protein
MGAVRGRVLLLGRAQTVIYTEVQGVCLVPAAKEWDGARRLKQGLESRGFAIDHIGATRAPLDFPETLEALRTYDAILIGDIAADTLLLHPEVVYECVPHPNRLELMREFVLQGGGLIMTGGWLTFQGIDAKGRWHGTPVEEILPVEILPSDDRVECPQGIRPSVDSADHPIFRRVPKAWPRFLGYSRVEARDGTRVLMTVGQDPFLVVGQSGKGRVVAFASSPGPHWGGMKEYLNWEGHDVFWGNVVDWACGKS